MADIAPKLIGLSADKLRNLHERLHKSEASPEVLEVHHLAVNEMLRRGLEAPENDVWDEFEILVDTMKNANLQGLTGSLPAELIDEVIKSTGSSVADVQLILTTTGYEMRLMEVVKKEIITEDVVEKAETFSPPKAVRSAARRALDWIAEGKAGSGFTAVGRARAGQLASGEAVSLATLKRIKSFLSRHEVDKNALGFSQGEKGYPSPGRVSWDAWGGDAGFAWAESLVARADREEEVKKHNEGKHDQKTHGSWADGIAEAIQRGEHPVVEKENVSAFLKKAAKRTDHPDLTELSVEGTMLFGDDGMGIARKDMPQIPGKERNRFLEDIEASDGITAVKEKVDPTTLKPIQKEISAARAGAIFEKFEEAGEIPKKDRILISKDGFVVDGHHTWGASVALAFDNPGSEIPVFRLSVNAEEALAISGKWSKENGFEGQAIDAPAKKALVWQSLTKHQEHDQSSHGAWARGEGTATSAVANKPDIEPEAKWSKEAVAQARILRAKSEAVEPLVTELIVDIQKKVGGEFVQLEERIKSTNSLARKIDGDAIAKYDGDRVRAAEELSDSVRYTLQVGDDNYAQSLSSTIESLEATGFELRTKNFWQAGDPYDGVNIKAKKDGLTVEVQLHTPSSFKNKMGDGGTHKIYEQYRVEPDDSKRESMWNQMISIAKGVSQPKNFASILTTGVLVLQQFETAAQAGLTKSTLVDNLSFKESK